MSGKRHWSECCHDNGVFVRIMVGLAAENAAHKTIMINATYLEAHRTASSLRLKRGRGRQIGRTKGGRNTKLHAVADAKGRPIGFFMFAGQVSDDTGAVGQPAEGRVVARRQGL